LPEAEREFKKSIALFRSHNKTDSVDLALATSGLAQVYFKQEQYQSAADLFQQSAAQWCKFSGLEKQNAIGCFVRRGDAL
ncbi:tetratricopeptide repeat protein, partial [Acinetobacter baumannii]